MKEATSAQKAPLYIKILYALGQFGWSLAAFGVADLLLYFYMPPGEGSSQQFPPFFYQGAILGFLTLIGIVGFAGRIFDAFTDPMIASMSDRSQSKFGRRRLFMAIAVIPFALFSYLSFYPIVDGSSWMNFAWLSVMLVCFYFFMTLYVTPYTAMISELGHDQDERLLISTLISLTYAFGFAVGGMAYNFQPYFEEAYAMSPTQAFQTVIGIFAMISAVFMLMPVLFINEKKYCIQFKSEENPKEAIKAVFANKNFQMFAASDLMYWMSMTFILMGIAYYVTILLEMDKSFSGLFIMGMLALSLLFYLPVNILAKRWGKKRLIQIAFAVFALSYGLISLLGWIPLAPIYQICIMGLIAVIPISIFSILPNAIVADITEEDFNRNGNYKPGMFFAARNFMMKVGVSLANLIFPTLLLFGKEIGNDTGIRLTGVFAMLCCLAGWWFFTKYQDSFPISEDAQIKE